MTPAIEEARKMAEALFDPSGKRTCFDCRDVLEAAFLAAIELGERRGREKFEQHLRDTEPARRVWDEWIRPTPTKHRFWGAGEPDCPRDIKAGNGELHTLRCKVCGEDNPSDWCRS